MEVLLWRILGNDLAGRHSDDITYKRLEHILIQEDEFEWCTKKFLLNRIIDDRVAAKLRDLLMSFGADFVEMPFNPDDYARMTIDKKSLYLTNQASAKNFCLDYGEENGFDYTIPADSSVMFFPNHWESIKCFIDPVYGTASPKTRLLTALVTRRVENFPENLESAEPVPEAWKLPSGFEQTVPSEPQLMFHKSCDVRYSLTVPYGFVNLEMLSRLNMEGVWDRLESLEKLRAYGEDNLPFTPVVSGSCVKLPSGVLELDSDGLAKFNLRKQFLEDLITEADNFIESYQNG